MSEDVNGKPSRSSFPRREARARQTRRDVLSAAGRLFVERGYGATTLQAIADEGGVAVQTVYAVFGNKRTLLQQLLDVAIAGDDEEIAVNEREWMRGVFSAPTAHERLRSYARAVREINRRAGDLFGVLEVAASVERDLVELAEVTESRRRVGARSVIDAVTAVGVLRPGLTDEAAVDVLWLFNGPAAFRQLVRGAGWTVDEYEAWLAFTMIGQLLP